jgi:hypothetical protein
MEQIIGKMIKNVEDITTPFVGLKVTFTDDSYVVLCGFDDGSVTIWTKENLDLYETY